MKRFLPGLLMAALLTAAVSVSAFAAGFTHCASALGELGLFRGTSSGYELDRAPTRLEAAAMLVRLLGQESAASQLTYTAPFTDVPAWAQPYVQYLYDKGLTNGKTDTTYGAGVCTAQQYATFLLRALGYSDADGGDFTYANALAFAREKGVVDAVNCDESDFLRDHVAAMSYTALSIPPKTGETDLLAKLVADGAVPDAKGYDRRFADFRAWRSASEAVKDANAFSMAFDVELTTTARGRSEGPAAIAGTIAAELNRETPNRSKMAVTITQRSGSSVQNDNVYYTGGMLYLERAGEKRRKLLFFAPLLDTSDAARSISACQTVEARDGGWRLVFAGGAVNGSETSVEKLEMDITFADGRPVSVTSDAVMRMTLAETEIQISAAGRYTDIKTEDVTVTLPDDLTAYSEILS